jgi:hypothetical protein
MCACTYRTQHIGRRVVYKRETVFHAGELNTYIEQTPNCWRYDDGIGRHRNSNEYTQELQQQSKESEIDSHSWVL